MGALDKIYGDEDRRQGFGVGMRHGFFMAVGMVSSLVAVYIVWRWSRYAVYLLPPPQPSPTGEGADLGASAERCLLQQAVGAVRRLRRNRPFAVRAVCSFFANRPTRLTVKQVKGIQRVF